MIKPLITYVILAPGGIKRPPVILETEVGHSYADVLQEIWDDTYGPVESVMAWTIAEGRSEDVTDRVARDLAKRTFAEGDTPESVRRFCEPREIDVFDEDRHALMRRDPNAGLRLGARQLGIGA